MPNYTGDLARYVLDRLFYNLTDKSYWNVDDWNNVDLLRIITCGSNSNCQLTIGVFSIAFAMSVIEKVGEFLNTLTMQYELRCKWWINAVVMILSVPHCLCWLFYFQNIFTFLFQKLSCAVEILIWSDAVDFLTKSPGMPYSVTTAQQACSTEMVKFKPKTKLNLLVKKHYYVIEIITPRAQREPETSLEIRFNRPLVFWIDTFLCVFKKFASNHITVNIYFVLCII